MSTHGKVKIEKCDSTLLLLQRSLGQLITMLENETSITLKELDDFTQAWVEMDYNKAVHSELKRSPVMSFIEEPSVLRRSPPVDEIKKAFMVLQMRKQRRTDGTVSIEGTRFEVPQAYRHFTDIYVRYARFDLAKVYLCCKESGEILTTLSHSTKQQTPMGLENRLLPNLYHDQIFRHS